MEQVSSLIRESQAALEEDTDRCQTIISCYSSSQRCVLKVTKDESRVQYDNQMSTDSDPELISPDKPETSGQLRT